VEGVPDQDQQGQDRGGGRVNWTRFLWIMLALLLLNWLLASMLVSAAARPTVSYSFFLTR
jgi:hypothetical protein